MFTTRQQGPTAVQEAGLRSGERSIEATPTVAQ